jgi:hypothetical protein
MNKISFILLFFIPILGFGQDDYVREAKKPLKPIKIERQNKLEHKFTVETYFSFSINESEAVPTGMKDSLNNDVNVNINGGNAIGINCTYQLNNKIDIELGYNYVASGMESGYFDTGYGCFERHSITPIISYSPFSYKNSKFKVKGGINYVFKNAIILDFDLPTGNSRITYDYGKSTGILLASEVAFRTNKKLSPKAGFSYTWNKYDLIEGVYNGNQLSPNIIPNATKSFVSSSLYIYFSLAITFSLKEN